MRNAQEQVLEHDSERYSARVSRASQLLLVALVVGYVNASTATILATTPGGVLRGWLLATGFFSDTSQCGHRFRISVSSGKTLNEER